MSLLTLHENNCINLGLFCFILFSTFVFVVIGLGFFSKAKIKNLKALSLFVTLWFLFGEILLFVPSFDIISSKNLFKWFLFTWCLGKGIIVLFYFPYLELHPSVAFLKILTFLTFKNFISSKYENKEYNFVKKVKFSEHFGFLKNTAKKITLKKWGIFNFFFYLALLCFLFP